MTQQEIQSALEAIIYAADEPATIQQLTAAIGAEKTEVQAALDLLVASYAVDERGIEIRKVAGGYKYYTKAQHHEAVRKFIKIAAASASVDHACPGNSGGDCLQAARHDS